MVVLEIVLRWTTTTRHRKNTCCFHGQTHHEPKKRHVECTRQLVAYFPKDVHGLEGRWSLVEKLMVMFSSAAQRIGVPTV